MMVSKAKCQRLHVFALYQTFDQAGCDLSCVKRGMGSDRRLWNLTVLEWDNAANQLSQDVCECLACFNIVTFFVRLSC